MKVFRYLKLAIVIGFLPAVIACSSGSDYGSDQHNEPDWVPEPAVNHWGGDGCNFGCW